MGVRLFSFFQGNPISLEGPSQKQLRGSDREGPELRTPSSSAVPKQFRIRTSQLSFNWKLDDILIPGSFNS